MRTCSRNAVASTAWLSASCCICSLMCALHSCNIVDSATEQPDEAAHGTRWSAAPCLFVNGHLSSSTHESRATS